MVESCDTIVSSCCNALIAILKDDNIKILIDNEESGLETDYKSYLNAMSLAGRIPDQLYDRKYLALKEKINETKRIKTKCINNLHTFRKDLCSVQEACKPQDSLRHKHRSKPWFQKRRQEGNLLQEGRWSHRKLCGLWAFRVLIRRCPYRAYRRE